MPYALLAMTEIGYKYPVVVIHLKHGEEPLFVM